MSNIAGPELVACTIVARNYLPAARVLAASYMWHHPGTRFVVLVVDALPGETGLLSTAGDEELLNPGELDLDRAEFFRMATAYTVTELCTALKPWLLRWALEQADVAVYFDPDIEIYAPLPELARQAVLHGIVLTPHVLQPMPRDGLRPTEADIMAAGVFNLGFVAVSREASPFLDFWQHRLRTDAISAPAEQLFTDQRWVDKVPALYRHVVVDDPGWNVAYWNVYQRPVRSEPNGYRTAGGYPLRFFHFSGYRPEQPWLLSTHFADRPRVLLSEHPELAALCGEYRDRLLDAGYAESLDAVSYRWNSLPDGTSLPVALRRAFRKEWLRADRTGTEPPPSPFEGDPAAFLRFMTAPADQLQRRAGSNRWAMAVWSARADLQHAFPRPLTDHAEAYREWCAGSGVAEGHVHPDAVPREIQRDSVPVIEQVGATVLGYLTAELGVGELGRLVYQAVADSGLPVTAVIEDSTVVNRTEHPLSPGINRNDVHYPVTVLCVNADMTATTLDLYPELAEDRYVIGVWSWELEEFPEWMHEAFSRVDEIWTISEFCRAALARHAPVPVHTFPVPIRPQTHGTPALPREPGKGACFLFIFDHNSVFERKNPLAVITAFQRAFPHDNAVRLVIKSINGDRHIGDRERLRLAAASDPRIELIERYLDHDEVTKLFASVDCYVSLHRAEGLGLTIGEAMAHGLPVIATHYSGSSELLPESAGWLVPATLVEVGPRQHPYPPDGLWAEPDLDRAAAAMRSVLADPVDAARRGAAGRAYLAATRSAEAAARWVAGRLTEAFERWQQHPAANSSAATHLDAAREALRWRADPRSPSRVPLAPLLRRTVLRTVDHYDQHQRTVLAALLDHVQDAIQASADETLARLEARLTAHEATFRARQRELTAHLEDRIEAVAAQTAAQVAAYGRAAIERTGQLDHKLVEMFMQRDESIDALSAANNALRTDLALLYGTVLHHHDVLDSVADPATSEAVVTDVGVLRLPANDTVMLPWLHEYGSWEPDEAAIVEHLLFPGATFVDIGAHIGYFSLLALRRVGPQGCVVAVEPWPPARELLDRNIRSNIASGLRQALVVLEEAAWDATGPLRLRAARDGNSGDNRITPDGELTVHGVRLDDVPAIRDRTVHVVKVDTQGWDHRALEGLRAVLLRDRPHVLCEFWPDGIRDSGDEPDDVLARYEEWGYRIKLVGDNGDAVDEPTADDVIRRAEESPQEFVSLWLQPDGEPARR